MGRHVAELFHFWPKRKINSTKNQGFHVEILNNDQALVIWFTYPGATDDPTA
jgi:hypothetical protein